MTSVHSIADDDVYRLGPLIVYEATRTSAGQWMALGFDPSNPRDELQVRAVRSDVAPNWEARPDDQVVGHHCGWDFRARPFDPIAHVVDLADSKASSEVREQLAISLLSSTDPISNWKPPWWYPRICDSAFVLSTGAVTHRAPPLRARHPQWGRPPLERHGAAATLAALLTGATTFPAALLAAQNLAAGSMEVVASRSHEACLLVEAIDALLRNDQRRIPNMSRSIIRACPTRAAVRNLLRQLAAYQTDASDHYNWRTNLTVRGIESLRKFDPKEAE